MNMATNTIIGTGVLAAALSAVVSAVLPPPPAMVVHELSFDGALVTQDRTVNTDADAFYMAWAAGVFTEGGDTVQGCNGDGAFPYAAGHKVVVSDLARWTGNEDCSADMLLPGRYFLRATWSWGARQVTARSPVFEVTG